MTQYPTAWVIYTSYIHSRTTYKLTPITNCIKELKTYADDMVHFRDPDIEGSLNTSSCCVYNML
jgi:tetrahydromethanopterin S-methyltransferase subunit B